MNEQDRIRLKQVLALRSVLFDIANSFGGSDKAEVAVELHGSCNLMLWACQNINVDTCVPLLPDIEVDAIAAKIKSALAP